MVRRDPNWDDSVAFQPRPNRLFSLSWMTPKIPSIELYPIPPERVPVGAFLHLDLHVHLARLRRRGGADLHVLEVGRPRQVLLGLLQLRRGVRPPVGDVEPSCRTTRSIVFVFPTISTFPKWNFVPALDPVRHVRDRVLLALLHPRGDERLRVPLVVHEGGEGEQVGQERLPVEELAARELHRLSKRLLRDAGLPGEADLPDAILPPLEDPDREDQPLLPPRRTAGSKTLESRNPWFW